MSAGPIVIERPPDYPGFPPEARRAIVLAICAKVAGGALVKMACHELGISRDTLHRWTEEAEDLSDAYAQARELQAHGMAEDALTIADGLDWLNADRLQAIVDRLSGIAKQEDKELLLSALTKEQVNRDRLRVDARKWLTSKIAPRLYGERPQREAGEGLGFVVVPEAELPAAREVAQQQFRRLAAASSPESAPGAELAGYEYVDIDETPADMMRAVDDPDAAPDPVTPPAVARFTKEQEILARRRAGHGHNGARHVPVPPASHESPDPDGPDGPAARPNGAARRPRRRRQ